MHLLKEYHCALEKVVTNPTFKPNVQLQLCYSFTVSVRTQEVMVHYVSTHLHIPLKLIYYKESRQLLWDNIKPLVNFCSQQIASTYKVCTNEFSAKNHDALTAAISTLCAGLGSGQDFANDGWQ